MELLARVRSGKDWGFTNCQRKSRSCGKVDAMLLEHMGQVYISRSLVYPAVGAAPTVTIDYTLTNGSYSTFMAAHLPPQ